MVKVYQTVSVILIQNWLLRFHLSHVTHGLFLVLLEINLAFCHLIRYPRPSGLQCSASNTCATAYSRIASEWSKLAEMSRGVQCKIFAKADARNKIEVRFFCCLTLSRELQRKCISIIFDDIILHFGLLTFWNFSILWWFYNTKYTSKSKERSLKD